MATTSTAKETNSEQLVEELRAGGFEITSEAVLTDGVLTVEGNLTDQDLADAVAAHFPHPSVWRDRIRTEAAFLDEQIVNWPANASTNQEALQRVNFLLAATKRLARNQSRILKFIDNATMDSD